MNRWRYYNPSPAGRNVGDCAVRAISKALGIDWETAYALIAMNGFLMNDVPSSNSVWGSVLRQNGFYKSVLHGIYVLGFGTHVATVKDGFIYDSWVSSKEIPVYYWMKE